MLPPKQIAARFCLVGLLYGLMVLPWPGVRAGYAAFFRAGGNGIYPSLIPGGTVKLHPLREPKGQLDTVMVLRNLRSSKERRFMTSSQKPGYLSTALVVALVLATPLPWRRRLWALLWGLILVTGFVACVTFVIVLYPFRAGGLALFGPPAPWDSVLAVCYTVATSSVVTWFIAPIFLWGLVCFQRSDWSRWVQPVASRPRQGQ